MDLCPINLGRTSLKIAKTFTIANPRFLTQKRPWRLPAFWNRQFSASHLRSVAHEIDEPIEEELFPSHRLRCFRPTHPGEILNGKFKTISKLGFGGGSTVWLAENLKFIQKIIADAKRPHDGLDFIRTPIDEFHLEGPEGTHLCLVYVPMRETLFRLQKRFERERIAPPLFKFYTYCLLHALDYLHTECHLIHTDIKDENIMVTLENDTLLTEYVNYQTSVPQSRHIRSEDGRVTYLSQAEFGPLQGKRLLPELADFNLCFPGLDNGHGHLSSIQSHRFRAPEVLLGCPWSYSADIWNFGLLMWNLLESISLFGRPAGEDGEYDAHVHLAQMVSLLGDPPEEVIQRERISRTHHLERPVMNLRGKECKTMNEYWGGPFFDDDGQILRKDLLTERIKLADMVTEMAGDEKEMFLDFASCMLQWLPEKRKTAKELLEHPLLEELHKSHQEYSRSIES
ncbi:unnamed protein product [Clonostachys rosea f. rosea IK726]|uniref:non-specific serine/threonine protein kinase n=2 Tax=Bionectria ochroleuca TaxID=29856 RepID=A0A0B7KC16_BIOOC|nr:unnamed protein product [Clonostachys rosea f. rosea IK726]